jgi:hypothetical protein
VAVKGCNSHESIEREQVWMKGKCRPCPQLL